LSFFEEDDEPRTRSQPRPRKAAPPAAPGADHQTLVVRRAAALGGGILLLLFMVLFVRGCLNTRAENALKDYNQEVSSIAQESQDQVGKAFFDLLSRPGSESATDLQTAISGYREQAETQLAQAKRLSTPGEMTGAQQSLLIALELRRDGLDVIAQQIRTALGEGDTAADGITAIAGQMEVFLASDVLYDTRVIPFIKDALDGKEIGGQQIADSNFMSDISWLAPATVASKLGQDVSTGRGTSGEPAPGTHGHGLTSVAVGDVTLQPEPAANRIPAKPAPVFKVTFENQGENDEFDVKVVVTVTPDSGKAIKVERTVDTVATKQTAEATLALPRTPPAGVAATVTVEVKAVPGEKKTDNNKQEYRVLFTSGA
jgi:hypothetical protein